jgi:TPR repeat protein
MKMAQFQSFTNKNNAIAQDRILLEMGMKYAIGRDCEIDVVEAHKWLNIAAIRGSEKAARMRNQVAATMSKGELAAALRGAREWMTTH